MARKQNGITLMSFLVVLVIVGFFAIVALDQGEEFVNIGNNQMLACDLATGEITRVLEGLEGPEGLDIGADGKVKNRTFYLADTEAFVGPCCAVPDIGGPTNRYFVVKPRNEWADAFLKWVKDEHNIDKMDVFPEDLPTPEPSDEDSDEEEADEDDDGDRTV